MAQTRILSDWGIIRPQYYQTKELSDWGLMRLGELSDMGTTGVLSDWSTIRWVTIRPGYSQNKVLSDWVTIRLGYCQTWEQSE